MPRSKIPIVSLEEAKARFQEWRNIRRGKARIPAELWSAAVEVARKEGINRTARELHVAWDDLKRRMPATGAVSQQPAFVELVAPRMQSVPECTLEGVLSAKLRNLVRRLLFAGLFDPDEQLVPLMMFA
jgi:hypothetical protein